MLAALRNASSCMDRHILHAHRAKASGMGVQRGENLIRFRRSKGSRAQRAGQLRLVQLMVAAQ